MKGLLRKGILAMLMLAMLVQMTGSVFAASVDWENGGTYYTAYTNKSEAKTTWVTFSGVSESHSSGYATTINISKGTLATCYATTNFPAAYKIYLNQCLSDTGLNEVSRYAAPKNISLTISASEATGNYIVVTEFNGYSGTWGVLSAYTEEGTRSYVDSGTFLYAPSAPTGNYKYQKA